MTTSANINAANRQIRVFISSTFHDMQAERDHLVKFIFPQLRRLCESRSVIWAEVDLRWGITSEEAAEGKVLDLCLDEIRLCRPYFIGLLGERYGWLPKTIRQDVIEREPWLQQRLLENTSLTEIEILHGVLNNPAAADHAFFYFRDPGFVETLPAEVRGDFISEDAHGKAKLAHLKTRIRASGCPLRENYADPQALGQHILADLTRLVDSLFPRDQSPDYSERESADHAAVAQSKTRVYIERHSYFERLNAHTAGDSPPLVVVGESGTGKSALLANWFLDYEKRHPQDFAIIHFIGSTSSSTDAVALQRRIMADLKSHFPRQLTDDIPLENKAIRDAFRRWLGIAAATDRFLIVLDGLNQLEARDNALELGWLPSTVPPNCRMIVSTLPGRSLGALRWRQWPELTVEPFTVPERARFIEFFLRQFSKRLSQNQLERISSAPQAANPLYLATLLDELRQFGSFDLLQDRLSWYLETSDPGELFDRVLHRWIEDFSGTTDLVGKSLSLIWAGRLGIAEAELLDALGTDDQPLPHFHWTPLLLAAGNSLVNRGGLLNFGHQYLRDAVCRAFVPTPERQKEVRLQFVEQLNRAASLAPDRVLDELPWQLLQTESWEAQRDVLTNHEVFVRLRHATRKWELHEYWRALAPTFDAVAAYREALGRWEARSDVQPFLSPLLRELASFHHERAEYAAAERLLRRALANDEASLTFDEEIAKSVRKLALLLCEAGRWAEAEPLLRRALALHEACYGASNKHVAQDLANLGLLLQKVGRWSEAEPLLRRALTIFESACDANPSDVAGALNNLASLLTATKRPTEAESLLLRALAIEEQLWGPDHIGLGRIVSNLGRAYYVNGRPIDAEPLMRRAVAIFERSYGSMHPDIAAPLDNLAHLCESTNRFDEAVSLRRRIGQIYMSFESTNGYEHPDQRQAIINYADVMRKNDLANDQILEGLLQVAVTFTPDPVRVKAEPQPAESRKRPPPHADSPKASVENRATAGLSGTRSTWSSLLADQEPTALKSFGWLDKWLRPRGAKCIYFFPDGLRLASVNAHGNVVTIWNTEKRDTSWHLRERCNVRCVAFSPDGKTLASGGQVIQLYDLNSGSVRMHLRKNYDDPYTHCLAFSPNGHTLASGHDGGIRLWDVKNPSFTFRIPPERPPLAHLKSFGKGCERAIAFSPGGRLLATASGCNFEVWDAECKVLLATERVPGSGFSARLSFSPDGQTMVVGHKKSARLGLWSLSQAGTEHAKLDWLDSVDWIEWSSGSIFDRKPLTCVAYSPDAHCLAAGGEDTIKLWDLDETGRPIDGNNPVVLRGVTAGIESIAFCPHGRTLVAGSEDGTIKVWQVRDF